LANIFESFSQAETTLDRSKGGLGLGLALVKGLSELHGGTVEAYSAGPQQGSRFSVRLPFNETAPSVAAPDVEIAAAAQDFRRILLIEDNRDAARSMQRLLQHFGFDVNLAFSGPQGLESARTLNPDVVICDIGLPEMDGFGVARALRADGATRGMYLIALTGYGQPSDVQNALDAGFDLHLVKPVDFTRLEEALTMASRRHKATVSV
jgi:CheY-like chemotaxis protein